MIRKHVMQALGKNSTSKVKNSCREGESNSSMNMRKNSLRLTKDQVDQIVDEWYKSYRDTIYRKIYSFLRESGIKGFYIEAEDLTQEVFIRAHRSLHGEKGPNVSTEKWLKKIAENVCYSFLKKNTGQIQAVSLEQPVLQEDESMSLLDRVMDDEQYGPERIAEQHELKDMLVKGLATLSFEQRRVIILVDILGYTLEQVVQAYPGRALSTVAEDRKKALEQLRTWFKVM